MTRLVARPIQADKSTEKTNKQTSFHMSIRGHVKLRGRSLQWIDMYERSCLTSAYELFLILNSEQQSKYAHLRECGKSDEI